MTTPSSRMFESTFQQKVEHTIGLKGVAQPKTFDQIESQYKSLTKYTARDIYKCEKPNKNHILYSDLENIFLIR